MMTEYADHPLERLIALLNHTPTSEIDRATIATLLKAGWPDIDGGDAGGMEAWKLDRMEQIEWVPPVLSFVIERHGGTVMGSSRAGLQHWSVDLDTRSAQITRVGHRQLRPMAPPVDLQRLADELTHVILERKDDPRVAWEENRNEVALRMIEIFQDGDAFKQTRESRRKRLSEALEHRLESQGWSRLSRGRFVRKSLTR